MNFGHNANINKAIRKITEKPKRQLQTDKPTEHLESFDTNEITNNIPRNTSNLLKSQGSSQKSNGHPFERVSEHKSNNIPSVWRSSLRSHKDD